MKLAEAPLSSGLFLCGMRVPGITACVKISIEAVVPLDRRPKKDANR